MKVIGYGKVGRSMPLTLDKCGFVGGDNEAVTVLKELALRHPEDRFWIMGRNSGERPEDVGLPPNVTNPWTTLAPVMKKWMRTGFTSPTTVESHIAHREWHRRHTQPLMVACDAHVFWLGQHGSSNTPVPKVEDPTVLTKPQDSFAHYASYIMQGINAWRDVDPWNREEVYLNADPRNYLKMRDLKWPLRHPILTQFNFSNDIKHERYGDPAPISDEWSRYARPEGKLWTSKAKNVYARLEPCGVFPGTPVGDMLTYDERWTDRASFGLFINEARSYVKEELTRLYIMQRWILPLQPTFIHGEWSDESLQKLAPVTIEPAPFSAFNAKYHSVRSTFTTPTSGSGWSTTKPFEAFACGTICFFHPAYDTQNNALKDADPELRDFLRVNSAGELKMRVERLDRDEELWTKMVRLQRQHFDSTARDRRYLRMIEDRLYGG